VSKLKKRKKRKECYTQADSPPGAADWKTLCRLLVYKSSWLYIHSVYSTPHSINNTPIPPAMAKYTPFRAFTTSPKT
jgi:hypothetical protein